MSAAEAEASYRVTSQATNPSLSPAHWAMYATEGTGLLWLPYRWARVLNRELYLLARARAEYLATGHTDLPRFLIIEAPVRHGKSMLGTIYFSSWWLGVFPDDRVILTAKNNELAADFARQSRDALKERGYDAFGVRLSKASSAAARWDLAYPHRGGLIGVGVGQPPTGKGGGLIVMDDPVAGPDEAYSEVEREKLFRWYQFSIRNRLEPGGVMVLIMSRWHEDDLTGRLKKRQAEYIKAAAEARASGAKVQWADDRPPDAWKVLRLPALAEPSEAEPDPLGRERGQALCPERYDEGDLISLRDSPNGVGAIAFAALYQGDPQPAEGGLFRRPDWRYCNRDEVPAERTLIRAWDLAATEKSAKKTDPDWTAGCLMARASDGRIYVLDVRRTREESADVQRFVRGTAIEDFEFWNNRRHFVPQDPGQAGKAQVGDYAKYVLPEFDMDSEPVTGDKVVRATPFASQQRSNNVVLVRGPWNEDFVAECGGFPKGTHDDMVDAASAAYERLLGLTKTLVRVW